MRQGIMVLVLAACMPGQMHADPLKPCPDKPNCVSSQAEKPSHFIAPLSYEGDPEDAWQHLQNILAGMKRVKIVTSTGFYLHAEFRTALFRFTDDVEFLMDRELKHIEVRSASRKGYADLGVNRRRVEKIRLSFESR